MGLQIGEAAPDFEADSTEGRIAFHDWIGDSRAKLYGMLPANTSGEGPCRQRDGAERLRHRT